VQIDLGFQGEATRVGFVRAKCKDDRPIRIRRLAVIGPRSGPGESARRAALLAQAQVASWEARGRFWAEPFCRLDRRSSTELSTFFLSSVSSKMLFPGK